MAQRIAEKMCLTRYDAYGTPPNHRLAYKRSIRHHNRRMLERRHQRDLVNCLIERQTEAEEMGAFVAQIHNFEPS